MKSIVICCEDLLKIRNLLKDLLGRYPGRILYAVPHTSRHPTTTEVNGVHGHFISEAAFKRLIKQDLFLEYSQVDSHHVGTSLDVTMKIHQLERICLIIVQNSGFKILKSKHFPAKYIYCFASSPVTLEPTPTSTPTDVTPATDTPIEPSPVTPDPPPPAPSANKSSEEEKAESCTETKQELSRELFDFTIDSSDSSSLEKFHSQVIQWFPELVTESGSVSCK